MPGIPQHPILPPPPSVKDVTRDSSVILAWGDGLIRALQRLWFTVTFTLNALSKVDTLANRSATPDLDEIFFTASDTKQTFVGVAGTWENVGPRRGSAAVTAAATTVTVTLSPAEPNANYRLSLSVNWATTVSWASKAAGSFVANFGTAAPGGGGTLDWTLTRD